MQHATLKVLGAPLNTSNVDFTSFAEAKTPLGRVFFTLQTDVGWHWWLELDADNDVDGVTTYATLEEAVKAANMSLKSRAVAASAARYVGAKSLAPRLEELATKVLNDLAVIAPEDRDMQYTKVLLAMHSAVALAFVNASPADELRPNDRHGQVRIDTTVSRNARVALEARAAALGTARGHRGPKFAHTTMGPTEGSRPETDDEMCVRLDLLEQTRTAFATDWTVGPDGRCNSSPEFLRLAARISQIIRESAFTLINGAGPDAVAGFILAQLAHKEGFGPR